MSSHASRSSRFCLPIALAASFLVLPSASAGAETIKASDVYYGTTVSKENCDETGSFVWVTAYGRGFCIRYYMSQVVGAGNRPVVYLSGDKDTARFQADETSSFIGRFFIRVLDLIDQRISGTKSRDVDTNKLMARAREMSRTTQTTSIYLARMGLDGSSGYHRQRRTMLELQVMNAALDALKRRYGFDGFHLIGQSGGSTLTAAILALRNDIGCAVPGSGRLARLRKRNANAGAMEWLDPSGTIPDIVRNGSKILVVTDPKDQTVRRKHQDTFVKLFGKAGGHIGQFYVHAPDKKHHHVMDFSLIVAKGCIAKESDEKIANSLTKQVSSLHRSRREMRRAAVHASRSATAGD